MSSSVHTYTLNGLNFAVDGNRGSIHLLDDLSFKLLESMDDNSSLEEVIDRHTDNYSREDITEAYSELMDLKQEKLLFTPISVVEDAASLKAKDNYIKSLCLHVSHDCNLSCEYCFASKGDYKSGRSLMKSEVALRAVDFILENCGRRKNIEIDFFGGEPMMNFEVVKDAVRYAREKGKAAGKNFYFTITTNGTLLDDESIDFINENMDNVVISIDGRKEVHDAMRSYRSKKGSYDKTVPDALKLVAGRKDKSYFVRGTFTSKNMDFSKDVMHLADLGFREISVEPVVGDGTELSIKKQDVPLIIEEYETLAHKYLDALKSGKKMRFYHFSLNLYEGPCIYRRLTACGAGYEYLAVSPEGHLYPCHQFVGQDEFIMGDIYSGINCVKLRERFKGCSILSKEKCRDCWAKLFCSGGCHANAWYTNGNIDEPNEIACTLQKKRIECAIMIQASLNM